MNPIDFDTFSSQARGDGFTEVIERLWAPDTVLATHSHPFSARGLVVQGQMWLTVDGRTRALQRGDGFEVPQGVPHDERYGPEGATVWVARRH